MRNFHFLRWIPLLFLLSACQSSVTNPADNVFVFQQSAFLMDTMVEIQVASQDAKLSQTAITAAFARMQAVEKEMSRFHSDSSVSEINQQAGQTAVKVSPDLFNLLQRGQEWGKLSQGHFDITIGAVSRLWNFEHNTPPEQKSLSTAISLVDYHKLQLNTNTSTTYLTQKGMLLDLGGIAKGYAVDEAIRILRKHGIHQALVNAGGDMRALGGKSQNQPWKVGLQHPRQPKKVIAGIALTDKAIVTSGDYERFFIKDGIRYHHIINPYTGKPAPDLISVTVIAPLAETADVLSTAVFVLGPKRGLELLAQQPNCEALLINLEGKIITTPGFPAQLKVKKLDLTGV